MHEQDQNIGFTALCPIFRWDHECKECNTTFEICYPPEIAIEYGMRNVKILTVNNKEAFEFSSPQPIDEFNAEVIANVCPFCGTPVRWFELMSEFLESVSEGKKPKVMWVSCRLDEYCCVCGERLSIEEIVDCIEYAKRLKMELEKAIDAKDHHILGNIVQAYPVSGFCRFCSDFRGYFCAYCRKRHSLLSSKYLDHIAYGIRRKSALREARKLYRKIVNGKEKVILVEVEKDVVRAIKAILDKKGISVELIDEVEGEVHIRVLGKGVYLSYS
jgi:hypothetical protein